MGPASTKSQVQKAISVDEISHVAKTAVAKYNFECESRLSELS